MMKITNTGFSSFQTKTQQIRNSETTQKESLSRADALSSPAATYESTASMNVSAIDTLTTKQKTENFTNYMLNRYQEFGLCLSSGLTAPKHGVAPSFSVDPRILEQAANDPEKAKELDDLLYGLTTIGTNLFHAINKPPAVKFSMSVHVNADGSIITVTRKEYSSLEAKNKYGGFDFNGFLDKQEELLEQHQSDFDYHEAIGEQSSNDYTENLLQSRQEERKWMREFRKELRMEEWIKDQDEEEYFFQQQQQKQFFDRKI